MDPAKASAPPAGWNPDDKSGMYPPPPYQDHLQYAPPGAYPSPGAMPPAGPYYPAGPGGSPSPGQPYPQGQYPQGQYGQGSPMMVQPTTVYVTHTPLLNPVPDHLGYSIFTMLCCCLPIGIAALIHSINTRDANNQGNRMAAEKNSKTARILNHTGLGIGLTVIVLYIVFMIFIVAR